MLTEHLVKYFYIFIQVPMGFLKSWVGMLRGVGHKSVLTVRFVRSWLSVFSSNVHYMIPRGQFFGPFEGSPFSGYL